MTPCKRLLQLVEEMQLSFIGHLPTTSPSHSLLMGQSTEMASNCGLKVFNNRPVFTSKYNDNDFRIGCVSLRPMTMGNYFEKKY